MQELFWSGDWGAGWLLRASLEASVLAGLVLAVQALGHRYLSARWRHALWWVMVARLLLPFTPSSPVSVFNWIKLGESRPVVRAVVAEDTTPRQTPGPSVSAAALQPSAPVIGAPELLPDPSTASVIAMPIETTLAPVPTLSPSGPDPSVASARGWTWRQWTVIGWVAGASLFGGWLVVQQIRLHRRLRHGTQLSDEVILKLLAECQRSLGVVSTPTLLETRWVTSPALCGLWFPRLLLPVGLATRLSERELRYVFLHELAHLKRRDIAVNWLLAGLLLVHWFNPVVWFAFRRMRADSELATDELALTVAGTDEVQAYGHTIVRLLDQADAPPAMTGIVGILEEPGQMRQRILCITRFRAWPRWSLPAMLALVVLGLAGLTGAQPKPLASAAVKAATDSSPTEKPERATGTAIVAKPESSEKLTTLATIGGVVKDESGQPLKGALVEINGQARSASQTDQEKHDLLERHEEWTDENGRWTCAHVPRDFAGNVYFSVSYPGLVRAGFITDAHEKMYLNPRLLVAALLAQTAEMSLKRGLVLRGRVLDEAGQPIADALVKRGEQALGQSLEEAVTDDRGEFHFTASAPGDVPLSADAKGFASARLAFVLSPENQEARFTLTRATGLRGRVVDTLGKPLENAFVTLNPARSAQDGSWNTKTDYDGWFVWNDAPKEPVMVLVLKDGFFGLSGDVVKPGEPNVLMLQRVPGPPARATAAFISGEVIDFQTRQPVPEFNVCYDENGFDWEGLTTSLPGKDGRYRVPEGRYGRRKILKIEAKGYLPAVIDLAKGTNAEIKRGDGIHGIVRFPDGTPAAGAKVTYCGGSQAPRIEDTGEVSNMSELPAVVTADAGGRFVLPPRWPMNTLVAVHARGVAQVPLDDPAATFELVLEPWGVVEGELKIMSRTGVNEEVWLRTPGDFASAFAACFTATASTGTAGKFRFERVPPGQYCVGATAGASRGKSFAVQAGQTVRIILGGNRNALTGRVVATADDLPFNFTDRDHVFAGLHERRRKPPRREFPDYEEYRAFKRSAAGLDPLGGIQYNVALQADGSFRVEDIPPGEYVLFVWVSLSLHGDRKPVGITEHVVTIGPNSVAEDRTIDVGSVPLHMRRRWDVGKVLPDFETTTHAGKPLRLSDYRGRHTVLAFWTEAQVEPLKALRDLERVWGSDKRVGLIGLNLGSSREKAEAVIAELKVKSPQGWAEQEGSRCIRYDFGVDGSRILYLVSPEGRLLAKSTDAAVIQKELERSLVVAR